MRHTILIISTALLILVPAALTAGWYRGSVHTHTVNSDGDSSPDAVAAWYKEHGYQFLVITDHNFVTDVRGLNALLGANEKFLVIPGEEVTDKFVTPEGKRLPVHMNAINLAKTLKPAGGSSVTEVLQRNDAMVNAAAGACIVNHPNYIWAFDYRQLLEVEGLRLFEVASQDPTVCNWGGGGRIGTEAIWDSLLSHGRRVFGVAGDDVHDFKSWGPDQINPGRGWVMVRADSLEAGALCAALNRGEFYFSNGVWLKEIRVDHGSLRVEIERPEEEPTEYTVTFIGQGGKVLATAYESPAVYRFSGGEGYVRAKVVDSNGRVAWTQPVWP
ncbi:CehA/McbA family metallohydrolase [bacterium]|nr:CehA/McbA family metallohydrolase [bacterium]